MTNLIKIVKIKKIVDSLIEFVRVDWDSKHLTLEEETFLYRLLNGNSDGDYDFYKQSQIIFSRDDRSPRKVNTSLMFNKDVKGIPHIHIREATKMKGSFNSLGGGMGEFVSINDDGTFNEGYRDTKKGSFEIIITSDNPLDTTLVSEVIYALLYGSYETLSREFSTFDISIKELIMNNELIPYSLYVKTITIDAQFDTDIPSIIDQELLGGIIFNLVKVNEQKILVSSIEVTGEGDASVIDTDGGILQMLVTVLPENAYDSSVSWSVVPGTGSAFIDLYSGVLTALTNGTVTVVATANDGSGVTGEKVVTISNQI